MKADICKIRIIVSYQIGAKAIIDQYDSTDFLC